MEYSIYTLEDVMEVPGYKEACQKFLALAKDDEMRIKLESILYKGGYANYKPGSPIGRNSPVIDVKRRLSLAYLLVRNPESFEKLIASNATFFHGTRSVALPSIINNGLNSEAKSIAEGIAVFTGEKSTSQYKKRSFVSFTNILDLAEEYSSLSDESNMESFPVILGTTLEYMEKSNYGSVGSDLQELRVNNHFNKEYLNLLIVPSDKVSMFDDILPKYMTIIGADDIGQRFYYVEDFGKIIFDENAYEKLKKQLLKEPNKKNIFQRAMSSFRRPK